jgi:hypothetical protein
MFANRRLFAAAQLGDIMDKVRSMAVPSLDSLQRAAADSVPPSVAKLVNRALEREPKDRYAGTTALLQAIETHAAGLMASPAQVGAYVDALVGNIFETRSRALERALAPAGDPEQKSNPAVVLRALGKGEHSQDSRPRAATTKPQKSSPKATAPIPPPPPKNRTTPTPKQRGSRPSVHIAPVTPLPVAGRASMKSSPPIIAALVDDAIAQGAREAKTSSGHVHPTLPPATTPLEAVIPGMPTTFELPGAELFATPGLPLVTRKPTAPSSHQSLGTSSNADPALGAVAAADAVNTEEPHELTELTELTELAELEPDPAELQPHRSRAPRVQRPGIWLAVLSLLLIAFMSGLAIRRCARGDETEATSASASASASARASAAGNAAASTRVESAPVLTATAAPTLAPPEPLADAAAKETVDAGAVRKPAVRGPQVSQRARKRTAAPRYNSKVTRSRGKTTH